MEAYDKEVEFALINKIDPDEYIADLTTDRREESDPLLQVVCKDCRKGVVSIYVKYDFKCWAQFVILTCKRCGSTHVDTVVL